MKILVVDDHALICEALRSILGNWRLMRPYWDAAKARPNLATPNGEPATSEEISFRLPKTLRRRNKAHLSFVASQPCLVRQRTPSDAHHLKFAQTKAMGRKVSDEFTVPLCRDHHNQLHTDGNEKNWWASLGIAPLNHARELWNISLSRNGKVDAGATAAMP